MLDRQDIDALLVGALYGELTPADEARLATHLESHPGDRSALDDLKLARQAVRDSRIFDVQVEPPQALSAILLQEAARRAPKAVEERGESWFARFVRSFVAHPAMAAAATLVLVVGVAGTLYLAKGNDQFAEQTAKQNAESSTVARHDEAPPATGAMAGSAANAPAANGEGVAVKLADNDEAKNDLKKVAADPVKAEKPSATRPPRERQQEVASHRGAQKKPEPISVTRPDPAPKDLEVAKSEVEENRFASPAPGRSSAAGAAGGGGATTTAGIVAGPQQQPTTAAPPPPPAPAPAMATVDKPVAPTTPSAGKGAASDATTSWAKDTHQRITALVRAGKCPDAAPLAVQIRNRAPDYYNSYVVNDRALKQCMAYINDAAERDAEKSQKSRPAKRSESLDTK